MECASGLAPVSGNACGLELTGDTSAADGDYVSVTSTPELLMTDRYTVATWVRIDSGGPSLYRPIVFRGADDDATNSNDFEVYTQWDTPYITVVHNRGSGGGSFDYVRFPVPPMDRYFHLAVTYDGSRVAVYYDGVVQSNIDRNLYMPKLRTSSSPWLFGKVNNSAFAGAPGSARTLFLDGGLDDVRIYDRTLTASEVDALRLGSGGGGAGLDLAISRDLYVACGGAIDADGRGWGPSTGHLGSTDEAAASTAGGSHGGRGGRFAGTGRIYGNLFDPVTPGASGGGSSGTSGGGTVRLSVLGDAIVDGVISARGGGQGANAHHGAGGSIRLDAGTLQGLGEI
ncbi:MAG: LamG domain-containing protein, partial [Acidobacteriota bacterium]